jgi:hypothetical protein
MSWQRRDVPRLAGSVTRIPPYSGTPMRASVKIAYSIAYFF